MLRSSCSSSERKVKWHFGSDFIRENLQAWLRHMRPWGKDPDATFNVFDPMLAQVTMMASQKMKTFMQKVTYVLLVPVIEKGESSLQQFGLVSEALLNAVSDALTHEDLMSDNELGSLLSLREVLEPMLVLPSNNIQDKVDNMAGIRVLSKNNGSGSSGLTLRLPSGVP